MCEEKIENQCLKKAGLLFWLGWTALTMAGYGVGFLLGFVLGHLGGHVVAGAVTGAVIAGSQFSLLRPWLRQPVRWVWAAIPGPALAGLAFDIGFHAFGQRLDFVPLLTAAGAVSGALQGLLLRRGRVWTVVYALVSAAAWPLSMYGFAQPLYRGAVVLVLFRNGILPGATAGAILGALTGAALVLLLRCGKTRPETNIARPGGTD
ncbi:hypothetical protein LLH00_17145 [bacterium]|nr:hypothetical protein [bacterium]